MTYVSGSRRRLRNCKKYLGVQQEIRTTLFLSLFQARRTEWMVHI